MVRQLSMEAVGTMFLVMTIGLSGNPLAIGLMLAVMVYIGGHISGGHYNPAVSLAATLRGALPRGQFLPYVGAQCAGALVGAAVVLLLRGESFAPAPAVGEAFWRPFLAETLFTFALCSVVLALATSKATRGNFAYGFAIGLTVTAGAFAVGGLSGGAFNPAVGVGPIVVHVLNGGGGVANLLLYLTAPFLGGALAAAFYRFTNPEEIAAAAR